MSKDKSFWVPDKSAACCLACGAAFTLTRRRHHCRQCGACVCNACSSGRAPVPQHGWAAPVRVCDRCVRDALTSNATGKSAAAAHAPPPLRRRHSSDAALTSAAAAKAKVHYDAFIPPAEDTAVPSELAGKHFFFDNINRASAERILADQPLGTCLIRNGSAGSFAVSSRKADGAFGHFALDLLDSGRFTLQLAKGVREFATAADAIAYLKLTYIDAVAAAAAAASTAGAAAGDDEDAPLVRKDVRSTIDQLTNMGFDRAEASRALLVHSGDVRRTIDSLVQSKSCDNLQQRDTAVDDDTSTTDDDDDDEHNDDKEQL